MLTNVEDRNLDASYFAIRDVTLAAAKELLSPPGHYHRAFYVLNVLIGKHRANLNQTAGGKQLAYTAVERLAKKYGRRVRAAWCRLCRGLRLPY